MGPHRCTVVSSGNFSVVYHLSMESNWYARDAAIDKKKKKNKVFARLIWQNSTVPVLWLSKQVESVIEPSRRIAIDGFYNGDLIGQNFGSERHLFPFRFFQDRKEMCQFHINTRLCIFSCHVRIEMKCINWEFKNLKIKVNASLKFLFFFFSFYYQNRDEVIFKSRYMCIHTIKFKI